MNRQQAATYGAMSASVCIWPLPSVAAEGHPSFGGFAQLTIGLVIVLVTMIGLVWLLRRYAVPRTGMIQVLAGLPLGGRERLLLVEVDHVRLLIGVTTTHVHTLHVFSPRPALAEETPFAHAIDQAEASDVPHKES